MRAEYKYITCCVEAQGQDINDMRGHPQCQEITYATMLKWCPTMLDWALNHNYDKRADQGLTLRADWSVSYYKSYYRGQRCYFLCWSAIEFIWVCPSKE